MGTMIAQLTSLNTKPAYTDVTLNLKSDEKNSDYLGNWSLGERYGRSLIKALNTNCSFWIDGNMVLNERGGPSWVGKYSASTVMTDDTNNAVFYKNPTFYTIGQTTKFVKPGAIIHRHQPSENTEFHNYIEYAVADNTDGTTVVIFSNRHDENLMVNF